VPLEALRRGNRAGYRALDAALDARERVDEVIDGRARADTDNAALDVASAASAACFFMRS
jgi:hypothetical protein